MQRLFNRRSFGLGLAIAAYAAVPAGAQAATVDTSMCSAGTFTQPFLALKDSNWYTLAPGMSIDNVVGTGWELSGGAKLATTTLADGKTGTVINLPSGSKAVSPVMCVTSEYPKARAYIRNVKGTEGVGFFVSYEGTRSWESAKNTGLLRGTCTLWTASDPVNLQPSSNPGWQRMRVTLIANGRTSDFQIYDLYLDPRMSH